MDEAGILALNEYEVSLQAVEDKLATTMPDSHVYAAELETSLVSPSDLDAWDYAWCLTTAAASTFLATNKAIKEWLAAIHDKSNGQSADTNWLQDMFAKIFKHKNDPMDWKMTRVVEEANPYSIFHRLFFGHDILELSPTNPFMLMVENQGLKGIIQAVRHLIADTLSKQGLPIPGHSFLDFVKPDGKPGNYIVELVQQLASETYGKKNVAEQLYEHLFTIRMQDIGSGLIAKALVELYLKARSIEDEIRKHEIRLIAYALSFYGEALVGMVRQKGVPYINIPLGIQMTVAFATFLKASNQVTHQLEQTTIQLEEEMDALVIEHERLHAEIKAEFPNYRIKGRSIYEQ